MDVKNSTLKFPDGGIQLYSDTPNANKDASTVVLGTTISPTRRGALKGIDGTSRNGSPAAKDNIVTKAELAAAQNSDQLLTNPDGSVKLTAIKDPVAREALMEALAPGPAARVGVNVQFVKRSVAEQAAKFGAEVLGEPVQKFRRSGELFATIGGEQRSVGTLKNYADGHGQIQLNSHLRQGYEEISARSDRVILRREVQNSDASMNGVINRVDSSAKQYEYMVLLNDPMLGNPDILMHTRYLAVAEQYTPTLEVFLDTPDKSVDTCGSSKDLGDIICAEAYKMQGKPIP